MTRKRINVGTAIAQILSEEEDIDGSDYGNESDFETEDDGESSGNDDNICDDNNLQQQQPVSSGSVRSSPCAHVWNSDTSDFVARQFSPNEPPGPKNIPATINIPGIQKSCTRDKHGLEGCMCPHTPYIYYNVHIFIHISCVTIKYQNKVQFGINRPVNSGWGSHAL